MRDSNTWQNGSDRRDVTFTELEQLRKLRDQLVASLKVGERSPAPALRLTDRLRREHILRQVEGAIRRLEHKE